MNTERPGAGTIAWLAIRPHTLPLSISPVLAGSVVGWVESGMLRPDILLTAGLSAMLIQIGTNLHNDAVDTLNGTDRADRVGPVRVAQRGWVKPETLLHAANGCYALAALLGAWLVVLGGWPILAIGLLSIAAAWSYSSGPWPISRGPLGELVVLLFFGLIAVGTIAWLHTGTLSPAALLVGLVVGLPATTVLLINNTRDIEGDRRAGRRTLAIVLGRRRALQLCRLFPPAMVAGLIALALLGDPWFGALAGLAGLVIILPIRHLMAETTAPELFNESLKRVVRFQLLLTTALCTGIVLTRLLVG
ncbi:MAG: 1,4-dihydroxy-2-naphthoate octaprenyltransferase [Wenzhouxiangellaceae bacterium]|nr:1,4-dihydroxy-2-naphthoate octaprenyltransferase [Wenzhouxiangellaceae bacterium]